MTKRFIQDKPIPLSGISKEPMTVSTSGTSIETTVLSDGSEVFAVLIEAEGQHIRLHARDLDHACDIQLAVEAAHAITD